MYIAVLGAGATGGYYGGLLAPAGHKVSLLARGNNLVALQQRGIEVCTTAADNRHALVLTTDPVKQSIRGGGSVRFRHPTRTTGRPGHRGILRASLST